MTKPKAKVADKLIGWLGKTEVRWNLLYGGAASGKSWAVALHLIEKACTQSGIGVLCLRKVRPAVKTSCWRLIHHWLNHLEIPYEENKSDLVITLPNGSQFYFDGVDNIEKKKSLEGINYVWVEEATEFTERETLQLNLRCRAENKYGINKLYLTFNPVDPVKNKWLKDRSDRGDTNEQSVLKVTHRDNPFLAKEERDQIEALVEQDEEYDKIYNKGEWATPTSLIYNHWRIAEAPESVDETEYGLDFGYSSNPCALIELKFKGDEVYLKEMLYQTGLTNPQLIEKLETRVASKGSKIIADSAEPKSIQEIKNAGFNIHPCTKGKDSVKHGIKAVKSFKVFIDPESGNLIREFSTYKWKVDKDQNVLDEPVKFSDHACDAVRYVLSKRRATTGVSCIFIEGVSEEIEEDVIKQRYGESA